MTSHEGDPPPAEKAGVGTEAGPSAPETPSDRPRLGLPKPSSRIASSPALARLNEMVVSALGYAQRDWLRGLKAHPGQPTGGDDLAQRMAERVDHVEVRRQRNIEAILQRTLRILPDSVDDGSADGDWAAAFFAHAADTADPEFSRIWARLLAQEVRRPGAVPRSAVIRLSGLPKRGLVLFRRFAAFAVNNFVIRLEQEFFDDKDLTADDILLLEEYGLLRTNRDLNRVFQSQREDRFTTNLLYADKALRITHDQADKQLVLACYRLTEFSTVLARVLFEEGEVRSDTDYIVEVVRMLQKQGFQTAQADILERSDEQVVSKHTPFCEIVALTL
jgi:hypothetical protein